MDVIKKFPSVTVEDRAKISAERLPAAIGFSLMLAWHYLILFSPAFGDMIAIDSLGFRYIFYRQLSLYISLAICFYMIWVLGKWGALTGESAQQAHCQHTCNRHSIHDRGRGFCAIPVP